MTVPVDSETHIPSPVHIPGPATTPTPDAVAPVVPVQPVAPVVPAVLPVTEPTTTDSVMDTGNAALDAAINVFTTVTKATEADMVRAVGKALEYGREDLIDVAFIKEKFGVNADQAIQLAKAAITEKASNLVRQETEVHTLAGGKANWDAAISVYHTNAPEYMKAAIVGLMDSGKVKEGTQMLLDFAKSQGLTPGAPLLDNPAVVPGAAGALDATGFRVELDKLYKEAGGRSLESGVYGDRYKSLMARRDAGRQLGR
jgi:hypothetical protein